MSEMKRETRLLLTLIAGVTVPLSALTLIMHPLHTPSIGLASATAAEHAKEKETQGNRFPLANCPNALLKKLAKAGFRGDNLKEAWAIAMRESRGQNLGPGNPHFNGEDWGIFQYNKPTFQDKTWWNEEKLLQPRYSAQLTYRLSEGGNDWFLWGLTGTGELDSRAYDALWTDEQIQEWILQPYRAYLAEYDTLPNSCHKL